MIVHPVTLREFLVASLVSWGLAAGCAPVPSNPLLDVRLEAVSKREFALTYQRIHDYNISFVKPEEENQNPMRYYTRLGTSYGPVLEERVEWLPSGQVRVDLSEGGFAGMWHLLDGLSEEKRPGLAFDSPYPGLIAATHQPKVVGVYARAEGRGSLKFELKVRDEGGDEISQPLRAVRTLLSEGEAQQTLIWLWQPRPQRDLLIAFPGSEDPSSNKRVREADWFTLRGRSIALLNWIAEGWATRITVDEIGVLLAFPKLSLERRAFLKSLAKLARCYDAKSGLVRDRANFPSGSMDSVAASGMFALAMAAAQGDGLTSRAAAEQVLERVHRVVSNQRSMPRARGLLPHFVQLQDEADGKYQSLAEYSTVDTALYYHGMLLAAELLGRKDILRDLVDEIRAIDFGNLHVETRANCVSMGVERDGQRMLTNCWGDWGGETALVLMLKKMAGSAAPFYMEPTGEVYECRGFIAEIQSLFYPQFGWPRPDELTGKNWIKIRREHLRRQIETTRRYFPRSAAAQLGLYGYSSGEGKDGRGYLANGACRCVPAGGSHCTHEGPDPLLFPHYVLMSAATPESPQGPLTALGTLEAHGLFPPWGLVENFGVRLERSLALIGSLNSSFEAISAYHLLHKVEGSPDLIYRTAEQSDVLRLGIGVFYPK